MSRDVLRVTTGDDVSPGFAPHLERWGPTGERCSSLHEAEAYCRDLATGHYENFSVVSVAIPKQLRQPMSNVYAFCRWADDLGDEVADTSRSLELLTWWQRELDACYAGEASHPVFVALSPTIDAFGLSKEPFDDLISAFVQDQTVTHYDTMDDLEDYCRRSANPVGRIVLRLFEQGTAEQIALSDSVCTGLQQVNFWQDVARDAAIGRCYLPADVRAEHGYTDAMLVERETNEAFVAMMRNLVSIARGNLVEGKALARSLRGRLRIAIEMFYRGGLAVCDKIDAIDGHVWDTRPTVGKRDAARIFAAALTSTLVNR